jgi:SNF2 family DNA or RNA helicase
MDQELYCELEPAEMKLYRQMVKNSIMELENEKVIAAPNVLTRLLRLSQMTGGYIDHQKVSSAKMKLLKETLGDILGAGKSPVIFCRFLDEIKGIEKYLQEQKINYSLITGATPMKDRGQEVEKFQTDDNCRVFLAQIQTAGLGITLTKSDICIYYSLSYSYADYEQSASRVHRIGQTQKVTYLYLIVQNSIDEKVLKVLRKKGDVAKMVVDDWRSFIAN